MAHTYLCIRIHCVWSTYRRHPWIAPVHLYLSLPPDISIAQLVSALKSNSSRWIHERFPRLQQFAWQQGYSAFSVSKFSEARLIAYIRNQAAHHNS